MKIAVTYENGRIFRHFGHTEQLKLYEAADGIIIRSEVVDTNGSGHGALAGFLMWQGVDKALRGVLLIGQLYKKAGFVLLFKDIEAAALRGAVG